MAAATTVFGRREKGMQEVTAHHAPTAAPPGPPNTAEARTSVGNAAVEGYFVKVRIILVCKRKREPHPHEAHILYRRRWARGTPMTCVSALTATGGGGRAAGGAGIWAEPSGRVVITDASTRKVVACGHCP